MCVCLCVYGLEELEDVRGGGDHLGGVTALCVCVCMCACV